MRLEWLTEEVEFQDVDAELRSGGVAAEWAQLAAQRREGDQVFSFASLPASWQAHAGRAGYALLRDGAILESVVTMMN